MKNSKVIYLSCLNFFMHAANNQFSDKFNNGQQQF